MPEDRYNVFGPGLLETARSHGASARLAHARDRMKTTSPDLESHETQLKAVLEQDGVLSVFRTDGQGRVASSWGAAVDDRLATKLDLLWGAGALEGNDFGAQEVTVLTYQERVVVLAAGQSGLSAAIATSGSVLGLLLNKLRRLAVPPAAQEHV